MAVQTSYPGVYVTELPSGVRTVTGVATSVTAFVGRTRRGPVNQATVINSLADYERVFGGLWKDSTVSFAVRDFFANGGGQAVVVRLVSTDETDENKAARARLIVGAAGEEEEPLEPQATTDKSEKAAPARRTRTGVPHSLRILILQAVDEGTWANDLQATLDYSTPPNVAEEVAKQLGVLPDDLFNLVVRLGDKGPQEVFRNVTVVDSSRRVDAVLLAESQLVRVEPGFDVVRPDQTPDNKPATVRVEHQGTDGAALAPGDYFGGDKSSEHKGLYALDHVDLFNLLCIPRRPWTRTPTPASTRRRRPTARSAALC